MVVSVSLIRNGYEYGTVPDRRGTIHTERGRARFCEYTVANAPKIVRMRLNKQPWSQFSIFFFFFFLGFNTIIS